MDIREFASNHGIKIEVLKFAENRYSAHFRQCEEKRGSLLVSLWGDGETVTKSLIDLGLNASGIKLVYDAFGNDRKIIDTPRLEVKPGKQPLDKLVDVEPCLF